MRRNLVLPVLLAPLLLLAPARAWGQGQQQEQNKIPTGVKLGFIYQTAYRPKLAVRPIEAAGIAGVMGDSVYAILQRDLDYSDRFEMAETPAALASGAVNYKAWNDLGVVYLVTDQLQVTSSGYTLRLALHDVVYGNLKDIQAFPLPPASSPDFRMAVHAAADRVVDWATGQPGAAASRIAFVYRAPGQYGDSLRIVDSDGANLHTVATSKNILMSPAWSPDGQHVMYVQLDAGIWKIVQQDLASGRQQVVTQSKAVLLTPTYAPDGQHIAYARTNGHGARIYGYDLGQQCCLQQLTNGPGDDLSPTYSPDGMQLAFNSSRLGAPHIYTMPAAGGEPTLLSPFVYGEQGYYTSPDWSPTGSLVVFHGRSRGTMQVMVADAMKPGDVVKQITSDGVSEDPSWAPDGRHVVFAGQRTGQWGLYVIDTVTGRIRPLLVGGRYRLPDWSPRLRQASKLAAGG